MGEWRVSLFRLRASLRAWFSRVLLLQGLLSLARVSTSADRGSLTFSSHLLLTPQALRIWALSLPGPMYGLR
eukprot:2396387-Rhodomonas_salina.1